MAETNENDEFMVHLEANLQIVARQDCECGPYLTRRRIRLLPEVLKAAEKRNEDPVDVLAEFMRGVHARHLAGKALT